MITATQRVRKLSAPVIYRISLFRVLVVAEFAHFLFSFSDGAEAGGASGEDLTRDGEAYGANCPTAGLYAPDRQTP